MITQPTVLVLGAGASASYDMPTAFELSYQIVNELRDRPRGLRQRLEEVPGITQGDVTNFCMGLKDSDLSSVDLFLSHRTEFMNVGKAAIADVLFRAEDHEKLGQYAAGFHLSDHWLGYVWEKLLASANVKTFPRNQLSIITFNYDRLVEYYLDRNLATTFNIEAEEAKRLRVSAIDIMHVHGMLSGRSITQNGGGSPEELQSSIKTIRVLTEGSPGGDDFGDAILHLQAAESICCLGFGYHTENIRRLAIPESTRRKNIFGTTVGLLEGEGQSAANAMGKGWPGNAVGPGTFITDPEITGCRDFLRRFDILR